MHFMTEIIALHPKLQLILPLILTRSSNASKDIYHCYLIESRTNFYFDDKEMTFSQWLKCLICIGFPPCQGN